MEKFWNERYSTEEFVYGKEPNEFFKQEIEKLNPGNLLLIGEGEGRNAVYAAKLGWQVDAVDFSESAKRKALILAKENDVVLNYNVQNLIDFVPVENYYDAVGIIYLHLEEELRKAVHKKIFKALKKDGALILEVFEKEQIKYSSGGPKDVALLYSLEDIVVDFIDLDFKKLSKESLNINEGKHHLGKAAVIRFVGIKTTE
ncbi:MAG: class I SAM-dependent methyltransferase [Ignavibacteriales bacterium]|nr:class I SAM-dependent methyltransferase [Ignavibacteriales bacterium]